MTTMWEVSTRHLHTENLSAEMRRYRKGGLAAKTAEATACKGNVSKNTVKFLEPGKCPKPPHKWRLPPSKGLSKSFQVAG